MPTLTKFMDWVKAGQIRNNIGQAAGWLIVIGHEEYRPTAKGDPKNYQPPQFLPGKKNDISGWKVGAYEPTTWGLHGDVEYLYTLNLDDCSIKCEHVERDYGTPADYNKEPKVNLVPVALEASYA